MVLVKKSKIFWNLFFSKIGLEIMLSSRKDTKLSLSEQ